VVRLECAAPFAPLVEGAAAAALAGEGISVRFVGVVVYLDAVLRGLAGALAFFVVSSMGVSPRKMAGRDTDRLFQNTGVSSSRKPKRARKHHQNNHYPVLQIGWILYRSKYLIVNNLPIGSP
jgi:hypothetical protein